MTVAEIVGLYYDAWQARHGDFSAVSRGPTTSRSPDRWRGAPPNGTAPMAPKAGPWVTRFSAPPPVPTHGNRVCSIIDWEMALPVAPMTSAEILEVEDGKIVGGELIYTTLRSCVLN